MSQGTIFLPEPDPKDGHEKVHLHEKPAVVIQKPGFTFWYTLALLAAIYGINLYIS